MPVTPQQEIWPGGPEATHLAPLPEALAKILDRHRDEEGSLIPVLQEIQRRFGYLPREYMAAVARELRRPMAEVFGVASFYAQFSLQPRGETTIRVCLGTACHVRGGQAILEAFSRTLGIPAGSTTPDRKFSLERVACLGACGLAPVAMINQETFGRLTPEKVPELLKRKGETH
ncbi:MAG: NADH-quinone oxidoreductase subunit NuoE [Clostridia bacterium]|jgi:NADH-quinone oxidoreductase subunit E|nr:NADH-quinone oxidoreductase subunit NuoE [Clostridia bacterium]MDH7573981.1 NADH-quinone oxidoreductase subunit NuoE [Clostridia bacterium]